jgi:hypothetical protein
VERPCSATGVEPAKEDSFNPDKTTAEYFKFDQPIVVVCTDKISPGKPGTWLKVTADKTIFAFLRSWKRWIDAPSTAEHRARALRLFEATARHVPVDFVYFDGECADFQRKLAAYAFQQQEHNRKLEERLAPSGWDVCCTLNQLRAWASSLRTS